MSSIQDKQIFLLFRHEEERKAFFCEFCISYVIFLLKRFEINEHVAR